MRKRARTKRDEEEAEAARKRRLVAKAYEARPERPVLTKEDWDRLPDRWFDER